VKAKIMLGLLLVVFGTAFGASVLSQGDPDPICVLNKPCQAGTKTFDGGPYPICKPGIPCQVRPKAFDGGPVPICKPGVPCAVRK